MQTQENEKLTELKKRQAHYQSRAFRLVIEVLFIFGVPALIAVLVGRKLDQVFETGKMIVSVLLVIAFFSSWAILFYVFRNINREMTKIDQEIKEEKERV
jgi:hypothetical protein